MLKLCFLYFAPNSFYMNNLILVADDDVLTRIHLRELLEYAGYQVVEANDGEQALVIYNQLKPDLILLDALMPVMDGLTCCERLHNLPGGENTPVLIITAMYDEKSVEKAFAVGATDYITKPIHWSVLRQRVRRLLDASLMMQELRQQTEQAKAREVKLKMALSAASMGTWDWDILRNKIIWSGHREALSGLEQGTFDGSYETFLCCIYPEDRERVNGAIRRAIEKGTDYDLEYRMVLPDGNIRWVFSKGVVFRDRLGVAERMSGVDVDITVRKQAESALEAYANRQALLAELSQMALAGVELGALIQQATKLVAQCLNVKYCQVLELLDDKSAFILRAGVGWDKGVVGHTRIKNEQESQPGYTLSSEEVVISEDISREVRFTIPQLLVEHQVTSSICVVIKSRGIPFGVLGTYTSESRSFSKDDIYFLQATANLLATAIERKGTEEKLRQSERRFQIIARATNDAVWDWDLQTNQISWNESVQKMFGYSPEQLEGDVDLWYAHIHPEDRNKIIRDIYAFVDSEQQDWSNEYRFRRADGSYAYIFDRGYVVRDRNGEPLRMIGAMMDIGDRKRIQEELQRQNLRSKLFANVTLKIRQSLQVDEILQTTVTEVQKLLYADRVLILRLLSDNSILVVKEAVVPGLPVVLDQDINDPCFGEKYIDKYSQGRISAIANIEKSDIKPCHVKFLQQFGVKANLVVPILLPDGIWGLLIAHQCANTREWTDWETELLRQLADQIGIAISQAKLLEQETRQRQELARSNEELQQFAFIASHDLQEPLRKIKAFGDRLQVSCRESLSPQGLDYLQRMQNAAGRMQNLIEDLLDLSRITTRAQPFIAVDLTQIVEGVLSDLEIRIQQTQAKIEIGELSTINADPLQIRQLLQNLIGNALKFHRDSVPPLINIYSQEIETEEDLRWCEIVVKDNGIGFNEKYLDRIFNVFQRLHGRSEYEGTGMGLAICRKIVERHKGKITAKSELGKGTSFIVTLPL